MCIQSWLRVKQHKGLIVFIFFELVINIVFNIFGISEKQTLSLIYIIMICLTIIIAFMLFQICFTNTLFFVVLF